jgi:hypothetical protein
MSSVLEKRRELLYLMRQLTIDKGSFTVNDIADNAGLPRSTAQDWVTRLIDERCVIQKEEKKGRAPARYVTTSAMLSTACRRIFTTIDADTVAIYHECRSGGCAAFCAYHHLLAGGVIDSVSRDGTILLEYAMLGEQDADIGLFPSSAVGIIGVRKEDGFIVQTIRSTGGPAYSLTDMMAMAEGVCDVRVRRLDGVVEGEVVTRALTHIIIGVDDTDSQGGGATFALALGLLQFMGKRKGIIPIGHRVVMLNPDLKTCTAGNSCSYIELAVAPSVLPQLAEIVCRFVREESLSDEWGVALKQGFLIPEGLRSFGDMARRSIVSRRFAHATADQFGVEVQGGEGIIGALAAVSARGLPNEVLLNQMTRIR